MSNADQTGRILEKADDPIDQYIRNEQERERLSEVVGEHLAASGYQDITGGENLLSPNVLGTLSTLLDTELYTLLVISITEALGSVDVRDREMFFEQFARWFISTPPAEMADMLNQWSEAYAERFELSPRKLSKAERSLLADPAVPAC